jgi:CBS domain-containing protein
MRKLLDWPAIGSVLVLLSPAALAAQQLEEVQTLVSMIALLAFALIAIAIAAIVYFKPVPSQDRSEVPLRELLSGTNATPTVQADALVMDCITKMTEQSIDSLLIMNGENLIGIFTDRDALRNVLIPGRDPRRTRICEVMTLDPCCVSPGTTVGAAMELVTKRHFKHLPIVEDGKVQAVLLRRDLKQWSAEDRVDRFEEPVKRYA